MWSDTLLVAERAHLLRLMAWGVGSVVVGTAILAVLAVRRARAPLLFHFALQTMGWGGIELTIATFSWQRLAMRDMTGATRLDRLVWFNAGLDLGYVGIGITLALVGWIVGRRLSLVGAGLGVAVQGMALAVLDLRFVSVIARLGG